MNTPQKRHTWCLAVTRPPIWTLACFFDIFWSVLHMKIVRALLQRLVIWTENTSRDAIVIGKYVFFHLIPMVPKTPPAPPPPKNKSLQFSFGYSHLKE